MKAKLFGLVLGAVLCGAVAQWAWADAEHYNTLPQKPVVYDINVSGASAVDASAPIGAVAAVASRARATGGNPTIAVSGASSSAAADTMAVTVLLWDLDYTGGSTGSVYWNLVGVQNATLTAGTYTDSGSDYVAPALLFDTLGARYYEVRHGAPSAGAWSLSSWVYGAAAE